jgi:hypothetical protein
VEDIMAKKLNLEQSLENALNAGEGVLHLAPAWVPRTFIMPGRRLKLDERDLYVHGLHRGGISERWFASTTKAENGPGTPEDEGLSYVVGTDGEQFLFKDAIASQGATIIGRKMFDKWGRWPNYAKFFDPSGAIALHLHQREQHAKQVGMEHKPEAYYFPVQMNHATNSFPLSFLGLEPGTTKEDIRRCLEHWHEGDNNILTYSKAYLHKPGTGWTMPAGILHAPGSMCIFEVLWGSDVFCMMQNIIEGRTNPIEVLNRDVPKNKKKDLDYIVSMIDWNPTVNPNFKEDHYLEPIVATQGDGFVDKWVIYGKLHNQDLFSAKELTVQPGSSAVIKDKGASGVIFIQGRGTIAYYGAESPNHIRYGEVTRDEFFITEAAAKQGVEIRNTGFEPLVLVRYFGPGVSGDMPKVGDYKRQR